MPSGTTELWVCRDAEELARTAAECFVDQAREVVRRRGRFLAVLSGGESPRRCYELLAASALRKKVPWHGVHFFWGDERFVPPGDSRSNARMARRALLDHVPLAEEQIHPIPILSTAEESARRYQEFLLRFFGDTPPRFDFTFLGLGENGHTASLFPHHPVLKERERWACAVRPEYEEERITLTAPVLNGSAVVVFLVSGGRKASVLREVVSGADDVERLPAALIHPWGKLIWLVDLEAARELEKQEGRYTLWTKTRSRPAANR